MKRKQIYLPETLDRRLNEIARAKGVPQAEVIREGLETYLQTSEDKDREWSRLIQDMKASPLSGLDWDREKVHEPRGRSISDGEK